MTTTKRSDIDWSALSLWSIVPVDLQYAVKVSETSIATFVQQTCRDGNVVFQVHATESGRVVGYTVRYRKIRNKPDVAVGDHYLGCFYSGTVQLERRDERTMRTLYHDQQVRFLGFGNRVSSRDYLLVLRYRDATSTTPP